MSDTTTTTTNPITTPAPATAPAAARESLSYKFQRLRERLRQAIASGELAGKLPGERELAKRFKANPKTLSKALTDLAGEGLLDRSIGRGTYVRGSAPADDFTGRWLIVAGAAADDAAASHALLEQFKRAHPDAHVVADVASLRPSFISQFDTVIDLAAATPEPFHRDLLVRGITSLLVNREPNGVKQHAVLLDRAHAAHALARDLFLAGHRRVVVIEPDGRCEASAVARTAAARYCPHGTVISVRPDDTAGITDRANTALLCDGADLARRIVELAATHATLSRVSIVALGVNDDAADVPCTGIFATPAEVAQAAVALLRARQQQHRPAVVWLTGTYAERGTLRAIPEHRFELVDGPPPTALSA